MAMQLFFCCGSATHEPIGLRCTYMKTFEEQHESINSCIAEIKNYNPITLDEYRPIQNKLDKYSILINILIFILVCCILITIILALIWILIPDINFVVNGNIKIALTLSLIQIFISIYFLRSTNKKIKNIIYENNLNTDWLNLLEWSDLDSFDEISTDSYQLISEISNENEDFKQKIIEVLKSRNGAILIFDYENLKIKKINNLYRDLKLIKERNIERDKILNTIKNKIEVKNND